jgi:hypothetical protein
MTRKTFQRFAFVALALTASIQGLIVAAGADTKPTPVTTTTVPKVVLTITSPDAEGMIDAIFAYKWGKVAVCETGGNWTMHGSVFSGALGIRNNVWLAYGGGQYAPHAGLADPSEQITIARRIQASAGIPNYVPDQSGCNGGW